MIRMNNKVTKISLRIKYREKNEIKIKIKLKDNRHQLVFNNGEIKYKRILEKLSQVHEQLYKSLKKK